MTLPRPQPLYFDIDLGVGSDTHARARRPRAGWLHRARPHGREPHGGVVICNPFGYEAICAHRSLRHFADGIAASGMSVLRFDYDGTGDSAGDDREPGRLDAWIASTRDAVRALREECGVDRVWLLGVRLGALIAALAARDAGATGLIALAPVVSGRAYLRELKLLQMSLGLGERPASAEADTDVGEGGQEALGFVLHAETRAALTKIDLTKLAGAPAREVLVLDRSDLPGASAWVKHLEAEGVAVDARELPGYVEMVLDPHKAIVPDELLRATTTWLAARAGDLPPPSARAVSGEMASAEPHAEIGDVVERPVFVDDARHVYGVLSAPRSAAPSGRAVLLLNAGAVHHVGPNRLYVALARQWAAAGDHVLRLDLSGIGDSPTREGAIENEVYGARAVDDIGRAIAWLHQQPHVRSVWSIGLCSGAYHALKGAVAGHEVDGIVAINPLTFFWRADQSLELPAFQVAADAERYQRAALDPAKWKKVLRGEVDLRRALATVRSRVKGRVLDRARDVARRLHVPLENDVGAELERLAARSVTSHFVFASGDPGRQLLADQGGSAVTRLRKKGHLRIDEIEGPDHTFTPVWSHGPFAKVLTAALDAGSRSRR